MNRAMSWTDTRGRPAVRRRGLHTAWPWPVEGASAGL